MRFVLVCLAFIVMSSFCCADDVLLSQIPYAPRPDLPKALHKKSFHEAHGNYVMLVDGKTGLVTSVQIEKSSGFAILDAAAVSALRRWRFKQGAPLKVQCPIRWSYDAKRAARANRSNQSLQPTADR